MTTRLGIAVAAIGGLTLLAALTLDANSHALTDVRQVTPTRYEGTTGKTHLVLTTKGCYHETPENGEEASFTWSGHEGRITFTANADACDVIAYTEN
ncbi:MAG TPA: hypothetical protein VMH20_01255 [Verrucomicrobiae bacterium]|nr:hypothetical protein [Verrucomicrobiae bacterium]